MQWSRTDGKDDCAAIHLASMSLVDRFAAYEPMKLGCYPPRILIPLVTIQQCYRETPPIQPSPKRYTTKCLYLLLHTSLNEEQIMEEECAVKLGLSWNLGPGVPINDVV